MLAVAAGRKQEDEDDDEMRATRAGRCRRLTSPCVHTTTPVFMYSSVLTSTPRKLSLIHVVSRSNVCCDVAWFRVASASPQICADGGHAAKTSSLKKKESRRAEYREEHRWRR